MTSPNRETEAQQVEPRVELIVLTKAKAGLRGKRGTIRVNLELVKTTTDQEQQKRAMILTADLRETEKEATLNQEKVAAATSDQEQEEMAMPKTSTADLRGTEKEAALNHEKVTAASDQEQEEMAMPRISKADRLETEKEAALNQEKVTAAISDHEQVKMGRARVSDLRVREVQQARQASNHARSKKAVLKKCQEMKAVVM